MAEKLRNDDDMQKHDKNMLERHKVLIRILSPNHALLDYHKTLQMVIYLGGSQMTQKYGLLEYKPTLYYRIGRKQGETVGLPPVTVGNSPKSTVQAFKGLLSYPDSTHRHCASTWSCMNQP